MAAPAIPGGKDKMPTPPITVDEAYEYGYSREFEQLDNEYTWEGIPNKDVREAYRMGREDGKADREHVEYEKTNRMMVEAIMDMFAKGQINMSDVRGYVSKMDPRRGV